MKYIIPIGTQYYCYRLIDHAGSRDFQVWGGAAQVAQGKSTRITTYTDDERIGQNRYHAHLLFLIEPPVAYNKDKINVIMYLDHDIERMEE